VACRTVRPKAELVRVVRRPDGSVTLDPAGTEPGRGAYLCPDEACRARARKRGSVERALRVTLGEALRAQLEESGRTAATGGSHGAQS
jgi:uncharacterized protein